jgi:hypothetical protein
MLRCAISGQRSILQQRPNPRHHSSSPQNASKNHLEEAPIKAENPTDAAPTTAFVGLLVDSLLELP